MFKHLEFQRKLEDSIRKWNKLVWPWTSDHSTFERRNFILCNVQRKHTDLSIPLHPNNRKHLENYGFERHMCVFLLLASQIIFSEGLYFVRPGSKWWTHSRSPDVYVQIQDLLSWVVRLEHVLSLNHLYHAASMCLGSCALAGAWLQKCLISLFTPKQQESHWL